MKSKTKALAIQEPKQPVKELTPDEVRATKFLSKELKVSLGKARQMLFADQGLSDHFELKKKELDLAAVKLIGTLQEAIKLKAERGSLSQAKDGSIALGILREKIYGKDRPATFDKFQIAGQNVNIRLNGWSFKPYQRPK